MLRKGKKLIAILMLMSILVTLIPATSIMAAGVSESYTATVKVLHQADHWTEIETETFTYNATGVITVGPFNPKNYSGYGPGRLIKSTSGSAYVTFSFAHIAQIIYEYDKIQPTTYTVTYNANGGSGAPASQSGTSGSTITLSTTVPVRSGYNFLGWSTNSSAASPTYSSGQKITISSNMTLYAVWSQIPVTYTLTYNGNGSSVTGVPSSQTANANTYLTVSSATPSRSGYSFQGWSSNQNATSPEYSGGNSIYMNSNKTLYAVWAQAAVAHTISYNANGGSGAPSSHTANANTYAYLSSTVPTRSGYTFLGWSTSQSATSAQYSAGQQVLITGNLSLYAVWSQVLATYTLSYNANGGSGAPGSQTGAQNTYLTVSSTQPTRTGYAFQGWSTNSAATTPSYYGGNSIQMLSNITLYAVWASTAVTKYNVTYNPNGGTGTTNTVSVNAGSQHVVVSQGYSRTGYVFTGWNTNSAGTGTSYAIGNTITVNSNITLYAQWATTTPVQSFVGYYENGGTIPAGKTVQRYFYPYIGDTHTVLDNLFEKSGHTFVGWNSMENGTGRTYKLGEKIVISEAVYLYAQWKANTYNITYNGNGTGVTNVPSSHTASGGSYVNLSSAVPVRSGYTFLGWSTTQSATVAQYVPGQQVLVNGDMALYAVWQAVVYTVTYDANGGSGAPSPQTGNAGSNITLSNTKPERLGHTFKGWAKTQTAQDAEYSANQSIQLNSNMTLYAVWQVVTHTVSYNANGGSNAPASHTANAYSYTNLSNAEPVRSGNTFLGWATTASATVAQYGAGQEVYITENLTLYAVWAPIVYTISYNANGGSGAPSEQNANANSTIKISNTQPTNTGFNFLGWSENQVATVAEYAPGQQIVVTGNMTLYAVWQMITFTITYNANGGEDAPLQQTVGMGKTNLSEIAPTRSGYNFLGWALSSTATEAQYSKGQEVNITGNLTLYAVWSVIKTITVAYDTNGGRGNFESQTVVIGSQITIHSAVPVREGFEFVKWTNENNRDAYPGENWYAPMYEGTTTLKAVWTHYPVADNNAITKISENLTNITDGKTRVGDRIRYTITVENKGDVKSVWKSAVLKDVMPDGVTFAGNVRLNSSALVVNVGYTFSGTTLTVPLGDIPGGYAKVVTFEVTVNDNAQGMKIKNSVKVEGSDGENGDKLEANAEETGGGFKVDNPSNVPDVNAITEGDKIITGKGKPGADIIVTLPDGTELKGEKVKDDGTWAVEIPAGKEPETGDVITVVQTEPGKDPSAPVEKSTEEKTHRTVHGFVWPIVHNDMSLGDGFLKKHAIVVELRATFLTPAAAGLSTTAVLAASNSIDNMGEFTIENVPFGNYILYIKRPGYLVRCMNVTVSSSDPHTIELVPPDTDPNDEGIFKLWWGDSNGNLRVDGIDVQLIMGFININARDPNYNPACDLDANGQINGKDIALAVENTNKIARQYAGALNINFEG